MNTPALLEAIASRWHPRVSAELDLGGFLGRHRSALLAELRPLAEELSGVDLATGLALLVGEGKALQAEGVLAERALPRLAEWLSVAGPTMRSWVSIALAHALSGLRWYLDTGRLSGEAETALRTMRADDLVRMIASTVEHLPEQAGRHRYSDSSLGGAMRDFLVEFTQGPEADERAELYAFQRGHGTRLLTMAEVTALARLRVGAARWDGAVADPMPGADLQRDTVQAAAAQLDAEFVGRGTHMKDRRFEDSRSEQRFEALATRERREEDDALGQEIEAALAVVKKNLAVDPEWNQAWERQIAWEKAQVLHARVAHGQPLRTQLNAAVLAARRLTAPDENPVPTVDVTAGAVNDIRHSTFSALRPAAELTPLRKRVLKMASGMTLGAVSKYLIYDEAVRRLSKLEHKALLQLVLGGYITVLRAASPLPGHHTASRFGAGSDHHYRLEARATGKEQT